MKPKVLVQKSRNFWIYLFLSVFVVGLLAYFLMKPEAPETEPIVVSESSRTEENSSPVIEEEGNSLAPSDDEEALAGDEKTDSEAQRAAGEYEIPVVWTKTAESSDLTFQPETALIRDLDKTSVKIKGVLHTQKTLVRRLKIKVELLDDSGKVLDLSYTDPIPEDDAAARPGDDIPLGISRYEDLKGKKVSKARCSVYLIQSKQTTADFEVSPIVKAEWDNKPANCDLEIRERFSDLSKPNEIFKTRFQVLEFAVKNTGKMELTHIKLRIEWLDNAGNLIENRPAYIVTESEPMMQIGHLRLFRGTYSMPEKAASYRLAIEKVEF